MHYPPRSPAHPTSAANFRSTASSVGLPAHGLQAPPPPPPALIELRESKAKLYQVTQELVISKQVGDALLAGIEAAVYASNHLPPHLKESFKLQLLAVLNVHVDAVDRQAIEKAQRLGTQVILLRPKLATLPVLQSLGFKA